MPVTLEATLENLDAQSEFVEQAIEHIDKSLSDPNYVQNMVCNKGQNPTFRFGIPGTATAGDKAKLVRLYREAGWGVVEVQNSEENGERAGMVGVTLKQH